MGNEYSTPTANRQNLNPKHTHLLKDVFSDLQLLLYFPTLDDPNIHPAACCFQFDE